MGDHVGVVGRTGRTKKGEPTVFADEWTFLSKALRPLPEKWHGLSDVEARQRDRVLDLVANPGTRDRFRLRTRFVKAMRRYLDDHGFEEVDTPVLQTKASGALARPFLTHHNALDIELVLRIAPETWLKQCVAGGLDRVYEVARCFRNEGMDPSHLQDFTMVEWYAAYWNYQDNMDFTEGLILHLLDEVVGSRRVTLRRARDRLHARRGRAGSCASSSSRTPASTTSSTPTRPPCARRSRRRGIQLERDGRRASSRGGR